eukprot:3854534-Amphidinium_carterae.1
MPDSIHDHAVVWLHEPRPPPPTMPGKSGRSPCRAPHLLANLVFHPCMALQVWATMDFHSECYGPI